MSLELERFKTEEHLSSIEAWGKAKSFPVPPPQFIPEFGLVAFTDGQMTACGFLYTTTTAIAWIEWIFGNPELPFEVRGEGIKLVIEGLKEEARRQGFQIIFSATHSKRLIEKYEETGFFKTDENVTHGLWRI